MKLREAAQQALEALNADDSKLWPSDKRTAAISTLRAALAELDGRQQTHSTECWRWHHECAVAKIKQHGIE